MTRREQQITGNAYYPQVKNKNLTILCVATTELVGIMGFILIITNIVFQTIISIEFQLFSVFWMIPKLEVLLYGHFLELMFSQKKEALFGGLIPKVILFRTLKPNMLLVLFCWVKSGLETSGLDMHPNLGHAHVI